MKIKNLIFICLAAISTQVSGQKFWQTSTGKIDFFSKTPVEDIEAHSKAVGAIVNTETGQLVFKVPIRTFRFPNGLMEEHFNENYMESEKFPDGTFSGKIEPLIDFTKEGVYNVKAKGKLKIHGVEVEREFTGTIRVNGSETATLESEMEITLADHDIKRPSLVFVKIAEKIAVKAEFVFKPKE